ncbi:MAG: hypothetical protein KGZ35_01410 [Truepera sp.]|nr:hypothetical protein [Truepera sp.]
MNTPRTVETDLVSFTWQVPKDGFRIVETFAISRCGAGATPPRYPDVVSAPPRQALVEERSLEDGHELTTYITHGPDERLELWIHNFGRDSAGENYEYDVFQDTPRLYETLADTPATPEGVLEFANKYGVLETRGVMLIRGYNEQERSAAYPAQPVDIWFERIEQMREVVTLWRMAKEGAFAQLRECFDYPLAPK